MERSRKCGGPEDGGGGWYSGANDYSNLDGSIITILIHYRQVPVIVVRHIYSQSQLSCVLLPNWFLVVKWGSTLHAQISILGEYKLFASLTVINQKSSFYLFIWWASLFQKHALYRYIYTTSSIPHGSLFSKHTYYVRTKMTSWKPVLRTDFLWTCWRLNRIKHHLAAMYPQIPR
jgi:hypothetical protein